jgi:hypothetical protein
MGRLCVLVHDHIPTIAGWGSDMEYKMMLHLRAMMKHVKKSVLNYVHMQRAILNLISYWPNVAIASSTANELHGSDEGWI